tara:strand:- start:177 stop:752 length:576 start_codon:yes stop_codon:yes gene_type:complete
MKGRVGWRRKLDGFISMDIRHFQREKILYYGCKGRILWEHCGRENTVLFHVKNQSIDFRYRIKHKKVDWEYVNLQVKFVSIPCTFGGDRALFVCPYCRLRCCILYFAGEYPGCKSCHNLAHRCEAEGRVDRALRQASKAQKKLGCENGTIDDIPEKPKKMHWTTYKKLVERIELSQSIIADEAMRRFGSQW